MDRRDYGVDDGFHFFGGLDYGGEDLGERTIWEHFGRTLHPFETGGAECGGESMKIRRSRPLGIGRGCRGREWPGVRDSLSLRER